MPSLARIVGTPTTSVRQSRPGENCTGTFAGNQVELFPNLYDSSGNTQEYWYAGCGLLHTEPGTDYEILFPRTSAAQTGISSARIAVSHDGKHPDDWSKAWTYDNTNPALSSSYRRFTVQAQAPTLDISLGLPCVWTMVDERLANQWASDVIISPAAVGPLHEVDRAPPSVDQNGRFIPEQIQRLYRFGTGPLKIMMWSDQHAGEHIGNRMMVHAIDALLAGQHGTLLSDCTFICSHTVNPGRYASHNRGYGVGPGSNDPNRGWGQSDPTLPFLNQMEAALVLDNGGPITFDFAIDYHGGYSIVPELWYPTGSRGSEFMGYMNSYDPGLYGSRSINLANSTQNAAIEQWGAQLGITVEIADITGAYGDTELIRFARGPLGGLELAIADGFFP